MVRASFLLGGFLALTALVPADRVAAQGVGGNLFAPIIQVNDLGITGYEIDQRMRFLRVLRAPGDLRVEAEKALIDDRLRMDAARRAGIRVSEEALAEGMSEFAGRANMATEQFIQAIGQEGVEAQTFRDFVEAGLAWRDVVRARFLPRVRISEADIDRALAPEAETGKGARVLISEIIIPAPPGREAEAMALARQMSALRGEAAFGAAAREVSAAGSRAQGGRLDWLPLTNLPPALRGTLLALAPGEASQPVELGGAVAVFMLRAIDEGGAVTDAPQQLDFAQYLIPGAGSDAALAEAARLRGQVDGCVDLFAAVKGQPETRLIHDTLPQNQIPADIAVELARLDPGEVSTNLTRGGDTVFLMLCKREALASEDAPAPTRDAVRNRLQNARLTAMADAYLADLRAEAVIRRRD